MKWQTPEKIQYHGIESLEEAIEAYETETGNVLDLDTFPEEAKEELSVWYFTECERKKAELNCP